MTGLIATLVVMFVAWIGTFGWRVFSGTLQTGQPQAILFLAPIVVLASLVVVSVLPIVRLVFRSAGDQEDDKDSLSIWQTLIKELADMLKQVLGRTKTAA